MTTAADNRAYYEHEVFDTWASRSAALTGSEAMLVERFLDAGGATLEAGTGGGRILFDLQRRGFHDLHGFDFVPGFIEVARSRDASHAIDFSVQDAVELAYADDSFDQAIYLQQVVCFIERTADRLRAMREARRVLRPGGTALFSFLSYEVRAKHPLYATFNRYLGALRRLRHSDVSLQYQPWLKTDTRPNLGALADRGPYVYWYRLEEALGELDRVGFEIDWAGVRGMLYVACHAR
jgi:SAM-dependent methyltransferase